VLLLEKEEGEEGEEEKPYTRWRIKSSKSMFGLAGESTWKGWVNKRESGENTILESSYCCDSSLNETEEKDVGTLFKLSVRELSRELFDTKPLVEQLFFRFTELFFSKMFIVMEEVRERGESGFELIGSRSFEWMYVFIVLFSRENDRFFCASKKHVSCFDDAPRERCILIDMRLFFVLSVLAKWFRWW
jgi:hypothetical protein